METEQDGRREKSEFASLLSRENNRMETGSWLISALGVLSLYLVGKTIEWKQWMALIGANWGLRLYLVGKTIEWKPW